MAFEIRERDLLARIGRLKTKTGEVETPVLLPVVNPSIQPISPKAMHDEFGCTALITNAYIIRKRFLIMYAFVIKALHPNSSCIALGEIG